MLDYLYLNSFFQNGLRNPIDEAVLAHGEVKIIAGLEKGYRKVGEIPFETIHRRMSVIVENKLGEHIIICKGAINV